MRDPALHLAIDQRWVDHGAAIVHAHVLDQGHPAGVHVDIHHRHVRPEGEREVGRIEDPCELQTGLHAIGDLHPVVRFAGHGREGDRFARRTLHLNGSFDELHVVE